MGTDAVEDVQVGIGMSINVCGELQSPTLFTVVPKLTKWIKKTIKS